jgi:hypothetical protein
MKTSLRQKPLRPRQVEGRFVVSNRRAVKTLMRVSWRFPGDLVSTDAEPDGKHLLEDGIHGPNRMNQFIWKFELNPGESRVVNLRYSLLIP